MRHTVERCFLDVSLHLSSFILCHMYKPQNIYSQLHKQTSKKPSVIQYKTDQTSSWIFLQHLEACYIIKQSTYVHNMHSTYVRVFTCVSSGKYIEKCVFSDQVVFISLIVLFFPRQGFEQDLENGYPQYPDTCHGEWRSVSSVMPLLLSLLLYYTNCSQNVFRWHPHLDLQVFFHEPHITNGKHVFVPWHCLKIHLCTREYCY